MSRTRINFNRDWRFIRTDVSGAQAIDFDDSNWQCIGLPHTFDLPYFRTPEFYVGYGWYRRTFHLSAGQVAQCIFLEFEGVFQHCEIFVNGHKAGGHQGGYNGFSIDIGRFAREGDNLVAIRVNNLWNPHVAPRAGEHIFSGGIYRDVWLTTTSNLHVTWNGSTITTPQVSHERAFTQLNLEIRNASSAGRRARIVSSIIRPDKSIVVDCEGSFDIASGETKLVDLHFPEIPDPQLWHPHHPNLHSVHTRIFEDDELKDEVITTFGIRWLEWTSDKGFFLNGEHLYLRGANLHQDQSGWGIGITQAAIRRDVQLMKDAGFNFIRGAHYPHHPAFARACDEIGMMCWVENCFWGKGGFGPEGYWNSSAYPANAEDFDGFEESCQESLRDMIRIHRNHPSIIAWSMTNEAFFTYNIERAKALIIDLVKVSHDLDPTRPAAIGGAQRGDVDKLGDIAGYNGDGAKLFINPGLPNMVSEYGAISKPLDAYEPFFGDLQQERFPWRSGQAIWCGADYGTIAGKQGLKGIVDHARLPKRSWYWYRNEYLKIPPPPAPGDGTAAMLRIEADKTTITGTDAIDDAQIIVTVCDKDGIALSNSPPITLSIESGPGEFPTGRSITFDNTTNIPIHLGKAAIAFRSYHGGKSLIRASSAGLSDASILIETVGEPRFIENETPVCEPRPYHPPAESEAAKLAMKNAVNVARDRPCKASSESPDHPARLVNDANDQSCWLANDTDQSPWWQIDMEGFYQLSSLRIVFPHSGNYRFILTTSSDGVNWETAIDRSESVNTAQSRNDVFPFGISARYLRVTCVHNPLPEPFGICELELFGVLSVR